MANMSYCRFENTYNDLDDCREHMNDELSGEEKQARMNLIQTCIAIAEEYGCELDCD